MNYFNINNSVIIIFILLLVIFCIIISFIFFIFISHILFKIFKVGVEKNNIYFYKYNQICEMLLSKFGNLTIKNIYLSCRPVNPICMNILDFLTLFTLKKMIQSSQENLMPYHVSLIFQLETENKQPKFIIVEKNSCINITETININENVLLKSIGKPKQIYTINEILETTKCRIGKKRFFNWHYSKNNCKIFVQEILKTINKNNNKNKTFIDKDKATKLLAPTELTNHLINSMCVVEKLYQLFIVDTLFFGWV